MQGKAIISKTLLTPEEAKDYCNGKKTKSGVKTYSGHGDYEINGSDYGYFYAMERVMGTFSPNLKFELKGYKLSNRSYIIKIDESETGEG